MEFSENKLKHVLVANLMINFISENERRTIQSSLLHEKIVSSLVKTEMKETNVEEVLIQDKKIADHYSEIYNEKLELLINQLKQINEII